MAAEAAARALAASVTATNMLCEIFMGAKQYADVCGARLGGGLCALCV